MYYTDEERIYHYEGNKTTVTLEQIENILLKYYDVEELDNSGCGYDGKWLSLEKIMEVIEKNV